MERREAIRNTALILGYAVSASTVAAVLNGCTSESTSSATEGEDKAWTPGYFNDEDIALITVMSEVILPATDTPGATDAEVYKFVDVMIGQNSDVIEQDSFNEGLAKVNESCIAKYGNPFVKCSAEQQLAFTTALDEETYKWRQDNGGGGYTPFFAKLKELTWLGYFTSELIGEKYLSYDPVPGVYHGCIPLEETGGKNWSL